MLLEMPNEILIQIIKFIPNLRPLKLTNKRFYELSKYIIGTFNKQINENYIYKCILKHDLFSLQFLYYNTDKYYVDDIIIISIIAGKDEIYRWFLNNTKIKDCFNVCILIHEDIEKVREIVEMCYSYGNFMECKRINGFIKWVIRYKTFDDFTKIFFNILKDINFVYFVMNFSIKNNIQKYYEYFIDFVDSCDKIADIAIKYDNCRVLQWLINTDKIKCTNALLTKCINRNKVKCQTIIIKNLNMDVYQIPYIYKLRNKIVQYNIKLSK